MIEAPDGGFGVAADQLENAAVTFEDVAADWARLRADMAGWALADDALGFLGRQAGVVGEYNAALSVVQGKTASSAASLRQAADELLASARKYTATETSIQEGLTRMASDIPEGPGRK
ncbi:hypothetical protein [Amycolatopsis sp. SID8362]|uniref:hypothetical protein n=1 Tax=Amycolatopsis sp. SID8362 TaxID=2690346 RepID=UPI00136F8A0F|nr:hypothetical protein [Amycolatopsis sp. SID8362]NBH05481.1 hypothetical protein [Amycolatopsis sp. SID8362]NED42181.1 hypothetical protein [Amycolatopsis sp. SID8362]